MIKRYAKALQILKAKNRLRTRPIYPDGLVDLACNDYLGLTKIHHLAHKAFENLMAVPHHAPRSSMAVNGYSTIHQAFEQDLAQLHQFDGALVVGSGFLANIALIESLVRNDDVLLIDEEFHASGVLATKLLKQKIIWIKHNDTQHLEQALIDHHDRHCIIAIEGIYSMSGDICPKACFDLALKHDALLIVDEAHSSGVLGDNCLGVLDFYGIAPHPNFIKMGTLGKAFGSYGAYILGCEVIIDFLQNRAKSIIYTTAPSLFDIALAHQSLHYIKANATALQTQIKNIQQHFQDILGICKSGLVFPIPIGNNAKALHLQQALHDQGILVGAIRTPTVPHAILRVIGNLAHEEDIPKSLGQIKDLLQ